MFTIRPFNFSDEDYQAAVECWNLNFPEVLETVEQYRRGDKVREPHRYYKRLVGLLDNQPVAVAIYCEVWWQKHPDKYDIEVDVLPEQQGKGFGKAMYERVQMELADRKPALFSTYTADNHPRGPRFLEDRGFKLALREPASRLELKEFDATRFVDVSEKVTAGGIRIEPLTALQERLSDWAHKLWELRWLVLKDVPGTAPWERETFEVYERESLQNPDFEPAGHFVALDGDRWVGLSNLWPTKAEPHKLWCGLTGVDPDYRRRGIAIALKVRAAQYASRQGYQQIDTDNEENNPMYDINMKLGFKPLPAWLAYELKLKD